MKSSKALILIDLQNDFFPKGALAVKDAPEVLPAINRLLNHHFDFILATKDWHPVNHGSFAPSHKKKPGEKILLKGIEQILWPIHCVQDTPGAEFVPGWNYHKVQKVFYKGIDKNIDSYSAFFDNGHIRSTGLDIFLQEKGLRDIYIAGVATDYCVKYSVLDALKLGFQPYVVTDACKGVNLHPNDSQAALKEMKRAGAILITSQEL